MHPSSFSPPRKRVSLIRSSTSPNPIIQLSSLVPTLPTHSTRRRLVRASTSSAIQSIGSEKEQIEGERPEMDSEQSQEGEEESNPFSSLVEDLERATRSQDEPEEEVETNELEIPLNTSIANELDKLLLRPFASHSRPLRREDRKVKMDYERDEEDSPNWSPEAMTFQLISRGEGGGGGHAGGTNGNRRISYDVPDYGEGWASGTEQRRSGGLETRIELVDGNERRNSSRWSFDKLFGSSTSQLKEADEEARRDRSRAEGRTRAIKRLKAVESHLAWSL